MKYIPYLQFILLSLLSCTTTNDSITINTQGYSDSTKVYLIDESANTIDSAYILKNIAALSSEVRKPTLFMLQIKNDQGYKIIWKENVPLIINVEKGNLKNANVQGSKTQIQAELITTKITKLEYINDSLFQLFKSLPIEDSIRKMEIRAQGLKVKQEIKDVNIDYIRNNPDQLYSAYILFSLMKRSLSKEETGILYSNLSEKIKTSDYGKAVDSFIKMNKELKIGDQAAEFELPDQNRNLVHLKDFKGKYLLLDFMSSGCGPCRLENPSLLKNYQLYKEKGFEIVSISFDTRKENWEKVIEKDSMIWTTVCDFKGSKSETAFAYNVSFMPTYFLIDPEGIILDIYSGRGQLDEKLKRIFTTK